MEREKQIKIGISPIAWANEDDRSLDSGHTFGECIHEMQQAGFSGTEIGWKFPSDWALLRFTLARKGLMICSNWFPTYFTTNTYEACVEAFRIRCEKLRYLGADNVMLSEQGNSIQANRSIPILGDAKPIFTESQWHAVAMGFNELGRIARAYGLTAGIHHHMGTGVQTEEEIDRIMEMTDPACVSLTFDTGHLLYAGMQPGRIMKKYMDRINYIHLKDIRRDVLARVEKEKMSFIDSVAAGVFTVPSDGDYDFSEVCSLIKERFRGWVLIEAEQDPVREKPIYYAEKARWFLKETIGL